MKTRTSGSSRWWRWSLSLLALVLLAAPAWSQKKGGGGGGGGKPGGSTDIPVSLTFDTQVGYKVTGDGQPYVDGQDGVDAKINSQGTLAVTLSGLRRPTISLSDQWDGGDHTCESVPEGCLWPPPNGTDMAVDNITLVVVDAPGSDAAADGELLDPNWPTGEKRPARMAYWFPDPTGESIRWTVRFRPSIWPLTNHVWVTKTSATTWDVTVDPPDAGAASCPEFGDCSVLVRPKLGKGRSMLLTEGYFRTPFLFTITRLP